MSPCTEPREPAPLAVVVLSLACEPGLVEAVRSVLAQDPAPEIVVVNSGGGDPRRVLADAGLEAVPVVHRAERLHPGAVRNLGVTATRARFVAFLAADCRAEPGWVEGRLRTHHAGADAVAALLSNAYPESRSAAASALLLHHRRMSHAPAGRRLALGLSFDRHLLERAGPFREDLRTGEDSEYRSRIQAAGARVVLDETVVTAHRYPQRPLELLRDQWARGARRAQARSASGLRAPRARLPLEMVVDAGLALWWTSAVDDVVTRRRLRAGWALVPFAALAYAAGSLTSDVTDPGRLRCASS